MHGYGVRLVLSVLTPVTSQFPTQPHDLGVVALTQSITARNRIRFVEEIGFGAPCLIIVHLPNNPYNHTPTSFTSTRCVINAARHIARGAVSASA